ncbi:MAG: glutamate-cysteine ligase family protein [Pseudolabrys sp.]
MPKTPAPPSKIMKLANTLRVIETRDELVAWLEAGSKPRSQFRVGTEHEKFVFTVDGHRPVPYAGPRSIRALLEGMHDLLGWDRSWKATTSIGLFDVTGGGAISLEPGGQFELSGAPVDSVHQTAAELFAISRRSAKWPSLWASAFSAWA